MIKNWERYRQYPHDHQKALFITITKHKAIDIMGKEKHESLLNEDDGGKEPDFSFLVATKEENENLILYVNKLPEKYKTPLELRYYQNMSNREIAKVLGLTPHAVVMRLSRALDELRKIMQEGEDSQ
jgi:RNA polymerase sigma factor for flagellar operon FliA